MFYQKKGLLRQQQQISPYLIYGEICCCHNEPFSIWSEIEKLMNEKFVHILSKKKVYYDNNNIEICCCCHNELFLIWSEIQKSAKIRL